LSRSFGGLQNLKEYWGEKKNIFCNVLIDS
jgi:hypothetical protein